MKPPFDIRYYDLGTGQIKQEKVFAASFLNWSYNTRFGRVLTQLVFSRQMVSRLIGWLCQRRFSRYFIGPFARWSQLDAADLPCQLTQFQTFSEFFTRPMAPGRRTLAGSKWICISPVDGKAYVIAKISKDESLRIKRCVFNLSRLLNDPAAAQRFDGGTAVIFRLCLCDYHRFHFPVSGIPNMAVSIAGRCYAGGPYNETFHVPFYFENVRMITTINSDSFGHVAMVEIGAFTVASIVQKYRPRQYVIHGEQKGWFEPGGSTVVLVFQQDAIEVDSQLLKHSQQGIETRLHCGDFIGRPVKFNWRLS